jgi:hypothetical protein
VVPTEDVPTADRIDVMPQVRQGTLDAPIALGRIFLGHLACKPIDLFRYS